MGTQEIQDNLKGRVTTLLVTEHEMLVDEAQETVETSFTEYPEKWTEDADANDLANFLASDSSDD